MEDGSAGGQRGGKNGLSLSPPSSSVSRSLSLSLPLHVFSCSSCRSPHSLSQGHTGRSFKGPPDANSAGTTADSRRTRRSEGD